MSRIIDTVAEWLRQPTRNWLEQFCVGYSAASIKTFVIFYCQILSNPFSHSHKQTVHILTLKHIKKPVTKYIGITCVHILYLGTKKHIFHPMCSNDPLNTFMFKLFVHYVSCMQYNQGVAHIFSDHLLINCSSHP